MNKADLIEAVSNITGDKKSATSRTVEAALDVISDALKSGDGVTLVGFGSFRVATRAARKGINPQTKAVIKIAEVKVPRFVAGQALKKAIAGK